MFALNVLLLWIISLIFLLFLHLLACVVSILKQYCGEELRLEYAPCESLRAQEIISADEAESILN